MRDLTGAVLGEEVITSFAEYDERDRAIVTIDPLGNVTTHAYDSLDREVRATDPLGNVTERVFDVYGNLVEVRALRTSTGDGTGNPLDPHVVRYQHDASGLVIARIDALGRRTEVRHDKWDRPIEQIFPDGERIVTRYDRDSLVVAVRDAHGVVIRNQHDPLGRATRTQVDLAEVDAGLPIEGTQQIDRTFDALGRLVSTSNDIGTITARFDSLGQPVAEDTAIGSPAPISYASSGTTRSEPMTVLYHGGRIEGRIGDRRALYLTPDRDHASAYANARAQGQAYTFSVPTRTLRQLEFDLQARRGIDSNPKLGTTAEEWRIAPRAAPKFNDFLTNQE